VRLLQWQLALLAGLWLALFLAWQVLAAVDFGYPLWYELAEIDDTIAAYGPRNRYRDGFEETDRREHLRLFGAIVDAVRHGGDGLRALRYRDPGGRALGRLLRPAEVRHLEDVAGLVARFRWSAVAAAAMLLGMVLVLRRGRARRPGWAALLGPPVLVLVLAALSVWLIGPERTFYAWHEQVFSGQWFFYYQESLMTTLMKAPVLFAYIAAAWGTIGLLLFAVLLAALLRLAAGGQGPCT